MNIIAPSKELRNEWINNSPIFRTLVTGEPPERIGTDWDRVINQAAYWGYNQAFNTLKSTKPVTLTESYTQKTHNSQPTTPKPQIIPKGQSVSQKFLNGPIDSRGYIDLNSSKTQSTMNCNYRPKPDPHCLVKEHLKELNYQERLKFIKEAIEHSVKGNLFDPSKNQLIAELIHCLEWYVKEDDVIETDEENDYWIQGKNRAVAAIKNAKTLLFDYEEAKKELDSFVKAGVIQSYSFNEDNFSFTIVTCPATDRITVSLEKV